MIRLFKSLQLATLFLIPIIIIVFWARTIFHSNPVPDAGSLPLWGFINALLIAFPSWVNFIFLIVIISGESIYMNLLMNRHEIQYKNSFLPAFVFALLISSFPGMMQFHPVHLINLLVLIILDRVFTLFKNDFPVSALFDCSFLTGIAALIYFPAVILIPFLLITLIVLRPFHFKEWLITMIGILLPYFFISVYEFWNHNIFQFWELYLDSFKFIRPSFIIEKNLNLILFASYILSILLFSLIKLRMNYRKNIIRTRSNQQIFLILLLFGVAWLMLVEKIEIIHFAFLIIPLSVFCSYFFISAKKKLWIYESILWGMIALIIWNHLY